MDPYVKGTLLFLVGAAIGFGLGQLLAIYQVKRHRTEVANQVARYASFQWASAMAGLRGRDVDARHARADFNTRAFADEINDGALL